MTTKITSDEEVFSNFGYISGYRRPNPIEAQIDTLLSHWPTLNPDRAIRYAREVYPTLRLPGWVEGAFAIIRPNFFSEEYGEEIDEVLQALSQSRNNQFLNFRKDEMKRFSRHERTIAAYEAIQKQQPDSDILVVPEQFGIRYPLPEGHVVCKVRRALAKMDHSEFGEGAKNVGTMLFTHPNRLAHYDDLWANCPGDKFVPEADGDPANEEASVFLFANGVLKFSTLKVDGLTNDRGNSVSGSVLRR